MLELIFLYKYCLDMKWTCTIQLNVFDSVTFVQSFSEDAQKLSLLIYSKKKLNQKRQMHCNICHQFRCSFQTMERWYQNSNILLWNNAWNSFQDWNQSKSLFLLILLLFVQSFSEEVKMCHLKYTNEVKVEANLLTSSAV